MRAQPYWYDSSTATQVIQAKLIGLVLMANAFRNNKEAHPTRVRLFVRKSYQPRSRSHIQWRRKRGTDKWYVYTFIADRPARQLKAKIRALTRRLSQQDLESVLIRLNQIMRGWSSYFRHAVAKHTFGSLAHFVWWRVIRMLRIRHHWRWRDVRRRFTTPTGRWLRPAANGIELFDIAAVTVTRYRYRGNTIPNPWTLANHA